MSTATRQEPAKLDVHRRNVTSQCGDDGVIAYLLALLPGTPKTCLEVGAGDGFTLSNTHTLWSELGWRALLIEADPRGAQVINERALGAKQITVVQAMITATGLKSLDAIAKRVNFPRELGVLSL